MSRTERLLELMIRLRTRGRFTVQELADECGVSRRTMLRDLQALSELGVPLASTPGPGGGYTLAYRPFAAHLARDDAGNGRIDVMVPAANLDYYARLFIRLGGEATVHGPPELIVLLRERAEAILGRYT